MSCVPPNDSNSAAELRSGNLCSATAIGGPAPREQDAADWRTSVGAANHDGSSMAAAAAD